MEMQEKARWDGQEESIVSDQQAKCRPQGEREVVQKRTFTRWMNVFLQRCVPPIEVQDLFTDIQDGRILMALLEELSGYKLLYRFRPSPHHVFRLNNISKALAFLDDRHVKLLGVDASGIADGVPSVVLDLMWNIVLFFQIKGMTGGLQKRLSSSLTSLSTSSSLGDLSSLCDDIIISPSSTLPTKGRKAAIAAKHHGKAIKTLLHWVKTCTSKFGVEVYDFGKSWKSGLAFLAMIKCIDPALVDLRDSLTKEPKENVHRAFMIAHHNLGIPPLMDPEDVICSSPDERSIITYVSMFLEHYAGVDEEYPSGFETNINVPEIPVFTSSESISFGESLAQHPEAQALLEGLENTNEQLLWKRWGSGSPRQTKSSSIHLNVQHTSKLSSTKSIVSSYKPQSSMEPIMGSVSTPRSKQKISASATHPNNSPLRVDINIVDQEVWSWMEKATEVSCKLCMDDFSHSSEEGMYNLSTLDSDEEEAFSYILELNRDICQSSHEHEGQGTKAEMGTRAQLRKGTPKPLNISGKGSEHCHTPHQESSSITQDNALQSQPRNRDAPVDRDNINEKKNGGNLGNEQQEITQDTGLRETVNDRDVEEHSGHEEEFKERALYVRDDNYDYEEEEDEVQEDRENIRFVRQEGEASCQDGVEEEVNVGGVKKKRDFPPESTNGEDTATYMNREKPMEEEDDDERNNGVRSSERKELAGRTQAAVLGIEAGEEVDKGDVRQGSVQRTKELAEFRDRTVVAGTSPMDSCDEKETERSKAEKRYSGHSGDEAMETEVREETEARTFGNLEPMKEKIRVEIEEEREIQLKGGWVEEGLVGQREMGEQRKEIRDVTRKIKLVEDIAVVNSVKFTAEGQDISTVEVDCGVREVTGVTTENRREAVTGAKDQELRHDSGDEDKVEESNGVMNTNYLDEVNAMMKDEEWQDQEENEKDIYLMEKNGERAMMTQSSAASCEVTASELEIIITLWILLYCYFIFPLMQ